MKHCPRCNQDLPETEFYPNRSTGRLQCYCKTCGKQASVEYRRTDESRAASKAFRATPEGRLVGRRAKLKHRYGISPEQVPTECQVCGSDKKVCVDHDHLTGEIRGFLCDLCNRALGYAKEDVLVLERLIRYLKKEI